MQVLRLVRALLDSVTSAPSGPVAPAACEAKVGPLKLRTAVRAGAGIGNGIGYVPFTRAFALAADRQARRAGRLAGRARRLLGRS